ncbi:ras and EF-hand domain-containing protein homolog isoform X2 [Lingula anatina]|uniref:Ras and EF-hand domain-containing protein homolog isoform X2 n=1 Tax=Lingula anatina TaxID=7574 RepID=A0A2R2MJJ4_LINAN|nr:ras and EF-hand domain-containing protein homolog isoform X2 [Lingula anatina]|eukprot:XP_023930247.1 ras and EF-hand domain-containing protein homolog isoform X2 [Lingula anatina]
MATTTNAQEELDAVSSPPSAGDIHVIMAEKAHELFAICDKEEKGFITKRDMQRLQSELPLSPDQLEAVFDSLDQDGNGFLTLDEFTEGFGSFLGLATSMQPESNSGEAVYGDDLVDPNEETELFLDMMKNVGAYDMFEDQTTIKNMWCRLRKDEPEVLSSFEQFLSKVSGEIKRSQADFDTLESALKSKSSAHDQEVRKLYEEMEHQIKQEKERILSEEKAKEKQLREEMEREMKEKDRQLQELLTRHAEMEQRLAELNFSEVETKQENEKLLKEREMLQEMLDNSQRSLEESKTYIGQLRQQTKQERRERAMAALQITEGIALERETLVKQLDLLRDMNKKLRDDKDEAEARRAAQDPSTLHQELSEAEAEGVLFKTAKKKKITKQGSIMSNYFQSDKRLNEGKVEEEGYEEEDEEAEGDNFMREEEEEVTSGYHSNHHKHYHQHDPSHHHVNSIQNQANLHSVLLQEKSDSEADAEISRYSQNEPNGFENLRSEDYEVDEVNNVVKNGILKEESELNLKNNGTVGQEKSPYIADLTSSENEGKKKMKKDRKSRTYRSHLQQIVDQHSSDSSDRDKPIETTSRRTRKYKSSLSGSDIEEVNENIDNMIASGIEEINLTSSRTMQRSYANMTLVSEKNPEIQDARRKFSWGIIVKKALETANSLKSVDEETVDEAPTINGGSGSSEKNGKQSLRRSPVSGHGPLALRSQPIGASDVREMGVGEQDPGLPSTPERLFKVIFVGDSGVGKSSFIHRFCTNQFRPSFSATIGVDFQVQTMLVDSQVIALQLWDTAGQERFRSITKQYFRKADGVLIMYDVTSESSFKSVRNWIASVQEGTDDGTVLMLVGNKVDLIECNYRRVIKTKDGEHLADENGALFYEASAKSGINVKESLQAMAAVLKDKEDKAIEKSLHLEEAKKKKMCC